MLKVHDRSTRKRKETCAKVPVKTSERHRWCHSSVFIHNFEQISGCFLVLLLLTLNVYLFVGKNCDNFLVHFEQAFLSSTRYFHEILIGICFCWSCWELMENSVVDQFFQVHLLISVTLFLNHVFLTWIYMYMICIHCSGQNNH